MISKRISERRDGKSSTAAALRYGEGVKLGHKSGEIKDKSHRTRFANFDIVDDCVCVGLGTDEMSGRIELAAIEMQANCDQNTRVGTDKKLAHFVVSFNQDKPSEAALRDVEDSMLSALQLDKNHFATFLHDDNGYWHLHIFASRIQKEVPHKGNSLWHDKIIRDHVCREIETRHGLKRDNGLHRVDERGQIVEIPRAERRENRNAKSIVISDKAKTAETFSGEKSFQTWAIKIRIGDRLKHASNWQDLHTAAAAYGCQVNAKGAGYIICPTGEKGGIQLSRIGLKGLQEKWGAFENAKLIHQIQPKTAYKPEPTNNNATRHFKRWCEEKVTFKTVKTDSINEQRETHKQARNNLRVRQKSKLEKICSSTIGQDRDIAVSVEKMEHAISLAALSDRFKHDRQALRKHLAAQGPGITFRDYLIKEAIKGDDVALLLAQKYGVDDATKVSRKREADQLKTVAAIYGQENMYVPRLNFTHHVERNGTVVFNLGQGRTVVDSAISRNVQLNDAAAKSPEAIETALRFSALKFGPTLTLIGSQQFQILAVETAVRNGLLIKFGDPELEQYRKDFSSKIFNSSTVKENKNVRHAQKNTNQNQPYADRGNSLHQLPECKLVSEPKSHQVLLQADVQINMGKRDGARLQGQHSGLRQLDPESAGIDRNTAKQPTNSRLTTKLDDTRGTSHKATRLVNKTIKQQESNRDAKTNGQSVTDKPLSDRKPLPGNLQAGQVAAKKPSVVER